MTGRRAAAVLGALVAVLALPYLVAGPNFHADDWVFVRNGTFDGILHAAGARQVGRPGATLVYDLTFGLIGAHPLVIQLVQVVLWFAAAVAVFVALRVFVSERTALVTAAVWVLVPTHTTLEMWASTAQALIALVLLGVGIVALARATDEGRSPWFALVLLAAAVAFYEVTLAAAVAAAVFVPLLRRGKVEWGIVVRGWVVVAIPFAWLLTHRSVYATHRGHLDPTLVVPGNLSLGLAPFSAAGRGVTAIALAGALVALARLVQPSLRGARVDAEQLAVAGLALIGVGVVPLAPFATNFIGMDDRLTVVSGVGAAMVWVGVVAMAARDLGRVRVPAALAAVVAAGALVVIATAVRVDRTRDFVDAGDAAVRDAHQLAALVADQRVVQVRGPVAVAGRIDGLNDGWNATAATQVVTGRPDVVVLVELDGVVTGPPPDNPQAQFR